MKTIFNSIKWYLHFAFSISIMMPLIRKFERTIDTTDIQKFDQEVYQSTKTWAKKQLKCAGVDVIVTGETELPQENVLFVSNHQGNFDIPVHMVYLNKPKGFIAKKSIESYPIINRYMKVMHSLFVDRDNPKESGKVILNGIKLLKEGHSLIIYPEGTRSQCEKVGDFKVGAVKLATKAKVKIVPVSTYGTFRAMEECNNKIKPATVRLHIHEPIDVVNLTKEEVDNLSDNVKNIIEQKVNEFHIQHQNHL